MGSVFTVPPGLSFVDALAAGLLAGAGDDPLALADGLVLLPTRRAARGLREAFLRRSAGRALLLPRIQPLGEVDDDEELILGGGLDLDLPPAVTPPRRQLLLARLVAQVGLDGRPPRIDQAVRLAAELAGFLDEVQTEGVPFDGLDGIVPGELALHWQVTLDFLRILREHWPKILAEEGAVDPVARRDAALRMLAARWRARPPDGWVVAAGSTGSVPATRELLQVIAGLPRGRVVLPGLDRQMDDRSWDQLDASHCQWALKQLVEALGLGRADVEVWAPAGVEGSPPARARFLGEVMRPAATTDAWQELPPPGPDALDGLGVEVTPDLPTEALNLACRMRAALEVPGRTAALVTPDRNLARRVAVELQRWGIEVDDSAGTPLDQTPPGGFLLLTAHLIVEGVTPVTLCATLKHPLARGGLEQGRFRRLVRALERAVLRGPRIEGGFRELCAELDRYADRERSRQPSIAPVRLEELRELCGWFKKLAGLAHPFEALCGRPDAERAIELPELLRAHLTFSEALAADEAGSPADLWAREAGEAAARFMEGLFEASLGLDPVPPAAYPALLAVLMAGCPVRPRYNRHPRLQILGPLEARLQHADLMLLGGLNEESWPRETDCGPWLSRPMREAFGLPPVERTIGLAAHDFVQAACAPVVVLSRAEKDEAGKPTVPSRWFVRLQAVLEATAGIGARLVPDALWSTCTGRLDRPDGPPRPCRPPEPRPPLEARPRRLSVAQVEMWMRDPYGVYARDILRLVPLEPLDAEPGYAERGQVIHRALAAFVRDHPRDLPPNPLDRLLGYGHKEFEVYANRPQVMAVWWPRFRRIAEWFVERERERRGRIERVVCEARGQRELGGFTLTAQADRIELLAGGGIAIIDYRTGRVPSGREVESGMSPQLSLAGVLARLGGFTDLAPGTLKELSYWALLGGERAGIVRDAVPSGRSGDRIDVEELAERALAGLRRLVEHFDDPRTPYCARPRPRYLPGHSDYDHLARVKEWAVEDEA